MPPFILLQDTHFEQYEYRYTCIGFGWFRQQPQAAKGATHSARHKRRLQQVSEHPVRFVVSKASDVLILEGEFLESSRSRMM